jgi:nucleoside-diphosphate-sugar epimerase
MSDVLILGGTRNLGHVTALAMLDAGHRVTVLNRGFTSDELPVGVERLRADRASDAEVRGAIASRSFDLVLDNTTYNAADARQAVGIFAGRTWRYVFISSGQVYLVRENVARPFREDDYDGHVMEAPATGSNDHASWLYGVEKRDAEDVFRSAWSESRFPVTILRLPMVASERDHYGRIQGYIARLMDGEPLLVPDDGPGLPLRHVYAGDVARLVTSLIASDAGIGNAFNISFGASLSLDAFIEMLASVTGSDAKLLKASSAILESRELLPNCSPFSGRWMSELDNSQSLDAFSSLGLSYTSPQEYLPAIARDYTSRWIAAGRVPDGYGQRPAELRFAAELL